MEPTQNRGQSSQKKLKLYVFGSRQSDQYYHPLGYPESKRPVCISTIPEFTFKEEQDLQEGQQPKQRIIPNPLVNRSIYKIACGGLHTVVLTSCGQVYTFGCNDQGALGRKGDQCIPMKVQIQDPVDLIAAGDNHSLFANSVNGAIYFTGNYNYLRGEKITESVMIPIKFFAEEIDVRNKNKVIDKIVSGANHSIVMVGGRIFCRGQPDAFTVGRRMNGRKVKQSCLVFDGVGVSGVVDVWCGGYHSVVKSKKGENYRYYCWGSNSRGQLGINNYQPQLYPVEIKKLRGKNVIKMAGGTFFSMFLLDNGQIYGCGSNENGNMGLGPNYKYQQHQSDSSQIEQKNSQKQEKQLQIKMQQNLVINDKTPLEMIQQVQGKQVLQEKVEGEDNENKENNLYIKSLRKVLIPQKISNISCGANFTYAWNQNNVYTWGFGMNYVLLNGQQEDQQSPFKVKSKILNEECIYDVVAGGQHVVYTAYQNKEKQSKKFTINLQPNVRDRLSLSRQKILKKRKN